ncbi:MAG: PEP-CTERM sorting domain-containing protein [Phycisphaerae bacterium]|nr:PEP-CTERM sorting domain-containing protein [Phycisphaerae bacterium]
MPYGVTIAEPVSVSFSTQTTEPVSKSGNHITVFRSSGTGEITGLPEPATLSLLALGGLTVLRKRRKQ